MNEDECTAPVRHEDDDALVVAITAVCKAEAIRRRPGFIQAVVDVPARALSIIIVRSRFDADYGSICRLRAITDAGVSGRLAFAPTFAVVDAMNSGDGCRERLLDLYNEWDAKGNSKT